MKNFPNEVLLVILANLEWKDLLPCRLMSKKWNLLATEMFRKNCPRITLSSRMEAICFKHLSKSVTDKLTLSRIRLALNKIPMDVLIEFAEEFSEDKIELTFCRQLEKTKTEIQQKAHVLLQNLHGLVYLKIESNARLWSDVSQTPVTNGYKFSKFPNLTKIVWNEADKGLLLAILPKAPALRSLEVKQWYDYEVSVSLRDAPLVMEHLPSNALLSTSIPSYCTQTPLTIGYISRMCQFQNKISNLTLQPLQIDGAMPTLHSPAWEAVITRLLESQSMSLTYLDIQCKQIFTFPKLEKLEFLKMAEFAEAGLDPSYFPSLKTFTVRGDLWRHDLFVDKTWTTVRTLELWWDKQSKAISEHFLEQIRPTYPNLKLLTVHLRQLPELIKFCQDNTFPAEELCVYATKCEYTGCEWDGVWKVISKMLSEDFPSTTNQIAGAKLGFIGLTKMKVVDVGEGILEFLSLASRLNIIKLSLLELYLIGSIGFIWHKEILSRYHDIVVMESLKPWKERGEDSEDESYYYVTVQRRNVPF